MARVWTCGNEFSDVLDGGSANGKWDTVIGTQITAPVASARSGRRGLKASPTSAAEQSVDKRFGGAGTPFNWFFRAYLNPQVVPSGRTAILRMTDTAQTLISIRWNTDHTLELWNQITVTQIGSDSPAMTFQDYENRLEIGYIRSTGVFTAYLNGTSFASGAVGDNVNNFLNNWRVGMGTGGIEVATGEIWMDDFAINDSNDSAQTSLAGEGRVVQVRVNAAGDNSQGTRGGTDTGADFSQLNEDPPDDATTYYIWDNANDILDLNLEDGWVVAPDTITLIHPEFRHRPGGTPGTSSYKLRIKSQSGGTLLEGTVTAHNDITWKTNGDSLPRNATLTSYTDPQAGGSWTPALLNTAQIGVEGTDVVPPLWGTALWATVEYVEAAATVLQDPILTEGVVPFAR